jgi:hypothetical protein
MSQIKTKQKYTTGQSWGALKRCWRGYRIAKVQDDTKKMLEYAKRIQSIQKELGINVASFPNIGL